VGFEQLTKRFKVAECTAAADHRAGTNASAQSLNPIPCGTGCGSGPFGHSTSQANNEPTGFDMAGFLQYASLDASPGCATRTIIQRPRRQIPLTAQCKITGGWIEFNNTVVRVPQNVVVFFPNVLITWEEVFEQNPNTHQTDPVFQTGLAMSDTTRFPGTYEVHVQGNIINANISPHYLHFSRSGELYQGSSRVRLRQGHHVCEWPEDSAQ